MSTAGHLARRFIGSLSSAPPPPAEEVWAESWLQPGELRLWRTMGNPDRRHAIVVARRFEARVDPPGAAAAADPPSAVDPPPAAAVAGTGGGAAIAGATGVDRPAMAAALLHDIGKVEARLGTFGRVAATLVPARWARGRFATYRAHETIGLAWCRAAGSDPATLAVLDGSGPAELVAALRDADEI